MFTAFWAAVSFFFLTTSLIRPYCAYHPFKELLCVLFIATVSVVTRRVTYPRLFLNSKHTPFWIVTIGLLLLSASAELRLVINEFPTTNPHLHKIDGYTLTLFFSVLLRNAAILGCNSQFIADQIHYGLSKRTVERYINQLKDMGLIERVGGNRNGGYRVVEKKEDTSEL